MKHWLVLSILGTVLIAGCGRARDEELDPETVQKLENAKDIAGSWIGGCVANPDRNLEARMIRIHLTFSKERYTERHYAYNNDDCSGEPTYFLRKTGYFFVLDPRNQEDPTALRLVDYKPDHIGLRPNIGTLINELNQGSVCGYSNWVLGEERTVSDRLCWGVTAYRRTAVYDVFTLLDDDSRLCLGNTADPEFNGSRESLRPKVTGPCYERNPSQVSVTEFED
ncbi:MAG TPA: hypothetical protein VFV50_09505 [Bdellovibrionales bacterium]|nr:hypothetical protein [Bdellovibrionales bacterium]